MPRDMSSTLTPVFSHKFDISLINVILVAKKAFEAYFINSAPLLLVETYLEVFFIIGKYKDFKVLFILKLFY